jgi:hypothetical protein
MIRTFTVFILALIALTDMAVGEVCFSGSYDALPGDDCYRWPDQGEGLRILEKVQVVEPTPRIGWFGQSVTQPEVTFSDNPRMDGPMSPPKQLELAWDSSTLGAPVTDSLLSPDIPRSLGEPVDAP